MFCWDPNKNNFFSKWSCGSTVGVLMSAKEEAVGVSLGGVLPLRFVQEWHSGVLNDARLVTVILSFAVNDDAVKCMIHNETIGKHTLCLPSLTVMHFTLQHTVTHQDPV